MNEFIKTFLAALIAFVVGNILLFILFIMGLVGIGTFFSTATYTPSSPPKNSILKIDLSIPICDNPTEDLFGGMDPFSMKFKQEHSLFQVLQAIDYAASDRNIDGIYLPINPYTNVGLASMGEIRTALERFKEKSGKFVVSYSDFYSQRSYYLSSVSDHLFLNPEGALSWNGMSSNILFYKGLLDKLGVKPEVIRHGDYKAAVEPLILDKMSPENRHQTNLMIQTIWGDLLNQIATSRQIDSLRLQEYATDLTIHDAQSALQAKMVDSLIYQNEVDRYLGELTWQEDKPNYISLEEYIPEALSHQNHKSHNHIALIYAEGDIMDGTSEERGVVSGDVLASQLASVRKDPEVKAVVLRINSPGGSAMASEVIWNEMCQLQQEKPVIVSMGNVAASGGYYIAAAADAIIASPTTITGSIGVFGVMFNAEEGLREKLGITVDVAKTNPSADMGVPFRSLSDAERQFMQKSVDRVYETFVDRVVQGRKLTKEQVEKIASGRVWSGASAIQIGLIDGFGGLQDAIYLAAERADLGQDYQIYSPSKTLSPLNQVLRMFASEETHSLVQMGNEFMLLKKQLETLQSIMKYQGVQARLPYLIELE